MSPSVDSPIEPASTAIASTIVSSKEDPEIERREDEAPVRLRREPVRRVRKVDEPPPELWTSPDLEEPAEDLEDRPKAPPAGCGSCVACIAKSGPCTRGKGPTGQRFRPDLSLSSRISGRTLPSTATAARPARSDIKFTCPACETVHWHGFVDGVSLFRCLRCGYKGHGFSTKPALDAELLAKYGPGNADKYDPRTPDRAWSKD